MNRWLLAVALGTGSFLAGMLFEVMGENSRSAVEFDKEGRTALCRLAGEAETIPIAARSDREEQGYLQTARRLVIFKKLLSGGRRFLVLYSDSSYGAPITVARKAAEKLGVELLEKPVKTAEELTAALERTIMDEIDGIFHIPDDRVDRHAGIIFETARTKRLPTMTFGKEHVDQGALAAYGTELYRCELRKDRLAVKISMDHSATDQPPRLIKRPFLEINLKTATEIGFEIPVKALLRADQVSNLNELIIRRTL